MNRTKIIQSLINKVNAKSYLEIGIDNGKNFQTIICNKKVSVDPNTETIAMHHLTSDVFFKKNTDTFDVIFIDGLHHADQVYRDIINSLAVLNDGGYIICHDMNPLQESHQAIPFVSGTWNGDCWKAFVQLRYERNDLQMHVVNVDHGCGVISKGSQIPVELMNLPLEYNFFDVNRKEWLNLITAQEFCKIYLDQDIPTIDDMLKTFVENPNDPENNFALALYYDEIGQTASAVSYYLRTAERTSDTSLKYECLIKSAACFEKQGTRKFTVKGLLQQAVALQPKRPEGYYFLSLFYETQNNNEGKWFDAYTISSIGLEVADFENIGGLRTNLQFPGKYALLFQKAHVAWWCGLCEESKNIFMDLHTNYEMNEMLTQLVYNNLLNLNAFVTKKISNYKKNKHTQLNFKFKNSDKIETNYSEAYQDMFVLAMHNGKHYGTYLEIGAGDAFYGNNSFLLEHNFGWKGVSFDIDENFVKKFNNERANPCILSDARYVDFTKVLKDNGFTDTIDYLQIDCDPPEVSFQVLQSIPFDKVKFGVITFEHDHYTNPKSDVREKAREYIQSHGYRLVSGNISPDDNRPYEDWFAHPDLIDSNIFDTMKRWDDTTLKAETYMLGK